MSIAVFFGGRSCEHAISVATGVQVLNAIKDKNPLPIYIRPDGVWVTGKELFDISYYRQKKQKKLKQVELGAGSNVLKSGIFKLAKLDGAIICCHGLNGEDGSLQGLLTLSNVPFTSSSVASSAVCLDKGLLKKVLKGSKIAQLPYVEFTRKQFNAKTCEIAEELEKIGWPLVVKPSRQGSSIGVKLVRDVQELTKALRVAFDYDSKVVVEKGLTDFTELNCAVLGRAGEYEVSEIEKPLGWTDILSFSDKYNGSKGGGKREFPAKIDAKLTSKIKSLSITVASMLEISGVARIDYMVDSNGKLWLNEINTVPGSLACYLFAPKYKEEVLLGKLLTIARQDKAEQDRLTYAFNAQLFASK